MSEARSGRGWDFAWFIAARAGALAIAIGSVALVLSNAEHESVSQQKAEAVHRAMLASRMKKSQPVAPVRVPMQDER